MVSIVVFASVAQVGYCSDKIRLKKANNRPWSPLSLPGTMIWGQGTTAATKNICFSLHAIASVIFRVGEVDISLDSHA